MINILLDREYAGPDIFQLAPSIPDIANDVIDLRWTNTKDELRVLSQFPHRSFSLHATDSHIFDRTVATFGQRLTISSGLLERAKFVLLDFKGYDWRRFSEELPNTPPRYVLLQLAADAIRNGSKPALAEIVKDIFIDGISPVDADVLLRLKSSRIRG